MANISFKIACRELKIAQIAHWVNQLFQLLNLVRLYGYRLLWVESDAIEENRVLKWWRHKNEISEIMGFVRIFWKNNVQEAYLPKMSISGQIVSEM